LTPGVTECQQRGIPQRTRLNHDAWFGKTYKPSAYDGSDPSRYRSNNIDGDDKDERTDTAYFENSAELYRTMPRTKARCMDADNTDTKVCKGGLGAIGRRFVKNPDWVEPAVATGVATGAGGQTNLSQPTKIKSGRNELEAAVQLNTRADISRFNRYPAWREEYNVCPVYPRMRAQLHVLRDEILSRRNNAHRFTRVVNQADTVASLQRALYGRLGETVKTACNKANPDDDSQCVSKFNDYKGRLADYDKAFTAFSASASRYANGLVDTGSIGAVENADDSAAMLAYLSAAADLVKYGASTKSAADAISAEVEKINARFGRRQGLTTLANDIGVSAELVSSVQDAPDMGATRAAYAPVMAFSTADDLNADNASARYDVLKAFDRERQALSDRIDASTTAITRARL
ncbi:MAG: hypothetical protein AAGJ87_16755, partial [Pseudomonadota bacterium]